MDTEDLSPEQWVRIFSLLSLDRVDPFITDMGLSAKNRQKRKAMLRRLILENRQAYAAAPSRPFDLADRVLSALAAEDGPDEARAFQDWAMGVFGETHADQPQWSAWSILFNMSPFLSRARQTGALLPERADFVERELASYMDWGRFDEKVRATKESILSDWDLETYALHGMNEEDDISDPFSLVKFVAELYRLQQFWGWLIGQLTPIEKDALVVLGQKTLEELGVWMPGPLRHPDDMLRVP